jgi:hypothetical protein
VARDVALDRDGNGNRDAPLARPVGLIGNLALLRQRVGGTVQRLMGARVWAPATGRPVPDLLP